MSNSNTGVGGKWTLIVNSVNQLTLSDALMKAADDFDGRKTEMFGKIGEMGTYWQGEDYDAFNDSTKKYDPALQAFSDTLRMYSDQFGTISTNTETLATELIDIVQNMTSV